MFQLSLGKRADELINAITGLTNNPDKTTLTKRQIDFYTESLELKRRKDERDEQDHSVGMKSTQLLHKKNRVEMLVSLQKNIMEMRAALKHRQQSGDANTDEEIREITECIESLQRERDSCLRD